MNRRNSIIVSDKGISACFTELFTTDIGNYEKAISDLLVSHGVVRDDSDCCSLMMKWHDAMDGAGMVSSPTGASCVVSECLVIVQQEPTDRSSLS
ncbi:MAG: hypothetical protein JSC189_001020 [Candidatus Tokpelaia sp. JSC189]|nr:MAG: hypothetical protein JSC189_001020 [Candidatus Tokpelaia sp. JSC189]